jgi:hypothetical protein
MTAVVGKNAIFPPQRMGDGSQGGFLPNARVQHTGDVTALEFSFESCLELADTPHVPVHLYKILVGYLSAHLILSFSSCNRIARRPD